MFLKQSTAYTFRHGPFLDDTDGKTAETGLTISQADVRLSKAGGDFAQKNESSASAHDEIGYYIVALDATDTNACGELLVAVHESGALPVFKTFQVLEETIYDSLFATSAAAFDANQRVDVAKIEGSDATDQVNAACDAAMADYDAPTKAEMDSAFSTTDGKIDTVDTEIEAIKTVVDGVLVDTAVIGAAGAGLTAVPWNSAWDTEVQSECTDALADIHLDQLVASAVSATDVVDDSIVAKLVSKEATADWDDFNNTTDSLQAIRDRGDDEWTTGAGGSSPTVAEIRAEMDSNSTKLASILEDTAEIGTAGAGLTEAGGTGDQLTAVPWNSSWDTEVQSECTDALADIHLDQLVASAVSATDVVDDSIVAKLVSKEATADWDDFNNTTDSLQAIRDRGDDEWTTGAGGSSPTVAEIRAEMDSNSTKLASILEDTETTIPATITTVDNEIAAIKTVVDDIETDTQSIEAKIDTVDDLIDTEVAAIKTVVDAILIDTETTIPATITTVDNEIAAIKTVVDAILEDTETTIPATISTLETYTDILDSATDGLAVIRDTSGHCLNILSGVISNAGTATETFNTSSWNSKNYRAVFAGLDTDGNRSGVTLSNP